MPLGGRGRRLRTGPGRRGGGAGVVRAIGAGIPVGGAATALAAATGADPLSFVLTGGDDHALLATFPPDADLPDDDLWASVAALPERQRAVVVLRYVADLDHAQIARALDTTPTMSRRLLSDALATLREAPR